MSMTTDLLHALRQAAPVDAMVADRIYPRRLPAEPTFPALVYQLINQPRDYAHDGPSKLARPTVQVSCWGGGGDSAVADAERLADRVRAALDGFSGRLGGGMIVGGLMLIDERDDQEPDTGWVRKIQDWRTWRREED